MVFFDKVHLSYGYIGGILSRQVFILIAITIIAFLLRKYFAIGMNFIVFIDTRISVTIGELLGGHYLGQDLISVIFSMVLIPVTATYCFALLYKIINKSSCSYLKEVLTYTWLVQLIILLTVFSIEGG